MNPYSNDLRKRVIQAYENKEGSIRQLALRFKVSKDFIFDLLKLYRETGSIEPKPKAGGTPPTLDEKGLKKLKSLAQKFDDATIDELCELYQKKHHVKVSRSAMGRYLLKLKLTRKKKRIVPQNEAQRKQKNVAKNTTKK